MVPLPGLEPGRPCEQEILNLSCLPFHQRGIERRFIWRFVEGQPIIVVFFLLRFSTITAAMNRQQVTVVTSPPPVTFKGGTQLGFTLRVHCSGGVLVAHY